MAGRLIDQEPYDRIFLDAANNNVILEVFPLDLPGRQVPEKPTQPLIVRLLNRPETKYEVAWSAVVKIELFEQRVLQEAQQFVQQGRFEEAYEYFQYLYEHYPKMAGLATAYQEALWQEAAHWYRQREYDRALAVLRTLWEKNKERPNLDRAMGMAVERLMEQYVSAEDYESARAMLRQLAGWYPQHETVAKWEGQFRTQAAALYQQARAALEKGALREASEAARKMIQLWPTLPGAQELWQEVRGKYPRLVVGVCLPGRFGPSTTPAGLDSAGQNPAAPQPDRPQQPPLPPTSSLQPERTGSTASTGSVVGSQVTPPPGSAGNSSRLLRSASAAGPPLFRPASAPLALPPVVGSQVLLSPGGPALADFAKGAGNLIFTDPAWWADRADWSARRTARLLGRCWMELVGVGSEGGQYRSPVASFQIDNLGRRLLLTLRPNLLDLQGNELTGYRLADLLLQLASPGSATYRPEWADRLESVSVRDIYTVEVVLRRPHVRPEAFLSLPIAELPGPYQLHAASARQTTFLLQHQYFAFSPGQFKEIVEIPFANPREALAALRAGKVDLVDRIPPTEVPRLQESKEIVVGQYALPVLHVLLVNPNRPLLANSRFRRALEYGIPREEILAQICGGIRFREGSPSSASAGASAKQPTRPEPQSGEKSTEPTQTASKPAENPAEPTRPNTPPLQQASQPARPETTSVALTTPPPQPKRQIQREIRLPPGFQVLSAPAPVGASYSDPIGYAYDRGQKARPYNPRLALALARLSWVEVSGTAQALLESPPPTDTAGPGAAGQPSATPDVPGSKPTLPPSTDTAAPNQPPSRQTGKPEFPPPKPGIPPSKEMAKPPEGPKTEPPTAPEKKPVADPFAELEEPNQQTTKEKPSSAQGPGKPTSEPSVRPGEKPSPAESPKPSGQEKPPAQQPADPFAEGASAPLPEKASAFFTHRELVPSPVPTSSLTQTSLLPLLTDRGPVPATVPFRCRPANFSWVVLEGPAPTGGADSFTKGSANQQAGSSNWKASDEITAVSAPAGGADPFAEEEPTRQPQQPTSEKPPPGAEKPAGAQPSSKPPEQQPVSQQPTAKAELPSSAEKPPGPASAEEKPVVSEPGVSEAASAEKPAVEYLLDIRPLRLVHPPTEPARSACRQIRRMLRRVGIPIELHEVHPADLFGPSPPEFDLAYVELVIQEPVADLPRLLTDCSPPGPSSSFLALALAEVYQSPGWPEVRQALYRLHQVAAWEVPIVPLWQTVEYFAYRRSVQGIRERPIRLYENVEEWRMGEGTTSPGDGVPKTTPTSQ